MKKKRVGYILFLLIVLLVIMAPIMLLYFLNNGNPLINYMVETGATDYLKEAGYTEEDILEQHVVIPKMLTNHDYYQTQYMVVFKDEPTMTYYYGKEKLFGGFVQFCEKDEKRNGVTEYRENATKHSEASCISMLENRE